MTTTSSGDPDPFLRRVVDNLPALIGYWDTEQRNAVANNAYLEYFGLTPQQAHGLHIRDVLGSTLYEMNRPYIESALDGAHQQFDRTLIDAVGHLRHVQATYIPDPVDGVVRGFFVHVIDISSRKAAEKERDDAVALFEASMRFAPIGQAVLDTTGRWLQVNDAMCELTGYTPDELRLMSFRDITHPDDVPGADRHHAQLLDGSRAHIQSEKRYIRKDGSEVWVQRNAVMVRGRGDRTTDIIIAQVQDITRRKTAEASLARQAVTDELTGLGNRHFLMAEIAALPHQPDDQTGLLFVDLDDFKAINDTHGHIVGDQLLVNVAHRIRQTIDDVDTAFRIGGDEFVIVIHSAASQDDVEKYRLRVKRVVGASYTLSSLSTPITITASVGSSWSERHNHQSLLSAADEHMYRDKTSSRTSRPLPNRRDGSRTQ